MGFEAYKITGYEDSIAALPDKIENNAAWLKAKFDGRTDKEVKAQHNALADALGAATAAAALGAKDSAGQPGTVQGMLDAAAAEAAAASAALEAALAAHTGRADNPHGVTAAQLGVYTEAEAGAEIARQIGEKMTEIGAGDMAQAVYDPDGDGRVELAVQAANAEQLGGRSPAEYATAAGLAAAGERLDGLDTALAALQTAQGGTAESLAAHAARADNPHGVTKAQLGLGNVNNTADSAKSVNYATTAGSARASNISMALSGTTLVINYS